MVEQIMQIMRDKKDFCESNPKKKFCNRSGIFKNAGLIIYTSLHVINSRLC